MSSATDEAKVPENRTPDGKPTNMGRPRIPIDWKVFEALCQVQCTEEEIASHYDCSIEAINHRCTQEHGMTFMEYRKTKAGRGKVSLRRKQFQQALKGDGNTAMLIFLGKQHLGQSDRREQVLKHGSVLSDVDYVLDQLRKRADPTELVEAEIKQVEDGQQVGCEEPRHCD